MNRVTKLFKIKYPIIQGGMVWCSGWKLASSVSNAGGLGVIGSGSMRPLVLQEHIRKCKEATNKPFAVNLPLLYSHVDDHLNIVINEGVKIVFTSAGSPKKYTSRLKNNGIIVVHVVSSLKFAKKCVEAGVDAIVCEGFEAGGHNGLDETTSFCLIPKISDNIKLPLIAAGGIYDARSMCAAMILGADGVQIGSRFAVCNESSAHSFFKKQVLNAKEGDTILTLKEITPVRLIKNDFFLKILKAYDRNATIDELKDLLAKGRAKKGIFDGDIIEGELEIGQVSSMINKIQSANEIIKEIINDYKKIIQLKDYNFYE